MATNPLTGLDLDGMEKLNIDTTKFHWSAMIQIEVRYPNMFSHLTKKWDELGDPEKYEEYVQNRLNEPFLPNHTLECRQDVMKFAKLLAQEVRALKEGRR